MAGENQLQEPAWLSKITDPDLRAAIWEEAKKEVMLNADYTQKTQALADKERVYQQQLQRLQEWEQFGQQMEPFRDEFNAWREARINGRAAQQQQQQLSRGNNSQAQVATQIDFTNWDLLPEQERVNRILSAGQAQYEQRLAQEIAQRERLWGDAIGNALKTSRESDYRYWNLVTDALEKKIDNPKLPLRDLLKEATDMQRQIAEGKLNPLDLAYSKLTASDEEERKKQEWMKAGEEERQRKIDAERQAAGVRGPTPVPILRQPPKKPAEITQAVRAEAEKAGIPWFSQ